MPCGWNNAGALGRADAAAAVDEAGRAEDASAGDADPVATEPSTSAPVVSKARCGATIVGLAETVQTGKS